ncbi:MAG: ABC transporter permease [Trueperaceae bacterium]|nr:MAG: ABC transporter permease [Trueperaceae bacterium]
MVTLAWRNLWRQRRRSMITSGAVGAVVFLSLLYYGMGGASINNMYQSLTEATGHIQVHVPDYRDVREFRALLIKDAASVEETLQSGAGPGEVMGVLAVPGLLSGEDRSRGIIAVGQDLPTSLRNRFLEKNLIGGRLLEEGDLEGILLGAALARALEVELGDDVYIYAPGTEGFGAAAYQVVGLLDLLDPNFESRSAYLSLAAAQELAAPGAVTHFEIHFPELRLLKEDSTALTRRDTLQAALPNYSVESWRDLNPSLVQLLDAFGPMMNVVNIIFFILAGLLVVNTVYLSLMERIHEFGVIISLGAAGRNIVRMITLESVLLCTTGAAIGTVLGLLLLAYWSQNGLSIPGLEEYYASFGLKPIFYPSVKPHQVLFSVGFAIATGILAALWPANVASRLEPVEAMRFTA